MFGLEPNQLAFASKDSKTAPQDGSEETKTFGINSSEYQNMLALFNESQDFQKSINFTPMKDQQLSETPIVLSDLQNNKLWLISLSNQDGSLEGSDGFYQLIKYDMSRGYM